MERIELNNWYIKGNELSISLAKFAVKIMILKNDLAIYYQVHVYGDIELIFNFYSIEDAISFTEHVVANSFDADEICDNYISMHANGEFAKPFQKRRK